jgi:hypothetical protein
MFPAPLKGLTARYTLNAQDANTALILRNVLCRRYGVELRRGYRRWVSNMPGPVRSVMSYFPPRGTGSTTMPHLFAGCADSKVYDVTNTIAPGTPPPVAITATLAAQKNPGVWSWTNFSAGGANFLVICSAGSGVWTYDAVGGWIDRTVAITGGPAIDFDFVMVWKNRLWFIALNSNIVWYLPVLSVQGVAKSFDFGPLLVFGGDVAALASWTLDAGDGVDDKMVVMGRGGDVLVYEGTDPASDFRIIGRWNVGHLPVGRRFASKYGGDLAIINGNGIERMSQLTAGRGLNVPMGELGGDADWVRYMEHIAQDVHATRLLPFWQMVHYAGEQCAIVVTPHNDLLNGALQYVFGTLSGGWSEFTNLPMISLELHDGELYFGTADGKVMRMFYGGTDDSLSDLVPGQQITAELQTAFVAVSSDEFHTKRPLMAMPMFIAPSAPSVKARINTDWSFQAVPGSPIYGQSTLGTWDNAVWDASVWGGTGNFYNAWVGAEGIGTHCSLRMSFTGVAPGTIFTTWKLLVETGRGVI